MSKEFIYKKENVLLIFLFSLGISILFLYNIFLSYSPGQFEQLTKSFLTGHLYLANNYTTWTDASYYKGFTYWPQGFFPALLLTPFAFSKVLFHQGLIQFILNLINLILLYKISLQITKNKLTSLWLSFAYMFSTAYIMVGIFSLSWWFAQVVATSALLLALYELLYKKRWYLIGVYSSIALTTRIDLIIAVMFFLIVIFFSRENSKQKLNQFFQFLFPIFAGLTTVFAYNFMRFGSIFEFGYKYHIPALPQTRTFLKQYGAWNIFYFPTNIYYLFFKGPDAIVAKNTKYLIAPFIKADYWGMSIFFTSPIFLWCFKANLKEKLIKPALTTTVLLLLFILGYFGIGANQYGFRYALDFYPFLFIILCSAFKPGMSKIVKSLIVVSFIFNLCMISSLFNAL
jgi:hypothetical protein